MSDMSYDSIKERIVFMENRWNLTPGVELTIVVDCMCQAIIYCSICSFLPYS